MTETLEIKPSAELAYWIGVAQTDGSFYRFYEKGGRSIYMVSLGVSKQSLSMLMKLNICRKFCLKEIIK